MSLESINSVYSMNLCGVSERVETPKALPKSHGRPPPSPLTLSITPSEFQTPRSTKGDTMGGMITATPSPALLNPLTHEFWNDSSPAHHTRSGSGTIFCPTLEAAQSNEPLIQRLQSGFRVVSTMMSRSSGAFAYEVPSLRTNLSS